MLNHFLFHPLIILSTYNPGNYCTLRGLAQVKGQLLIVEWMPVIVFCLYIPSGLYLDQEGTVWYLYIQLLPRQQQPKYRLNQEFWTLVLKTSLLVEENDQHETEHTFITLYYSVFVFRLERTRCIYNKLA